MNQQSQTRTNVALRDNLNQQTLIISVAQVIVWHIPQPKDVLTSVKHCKSYSHIKVSSIHLVRWQGSHQLPVEADADDRSHLGEVYGGYHCTSKFTVTVFCLIELICCSVKGVQLLRSVIHLLVNEGRPFSAFLSLNLLLSLQWHFCCWYRLFSVLPWRPNLDYRMKKWARWNLELELFFCITCWRTQSQY